VNAEAADPAKIRDAMRCYAQSKFDLVIGHGFEYNEPGVELANTYPDTVFISSSGGKTAKNAGAFRFYLEQGFYLAGMTAGLMTKSGKVAMVGLTAIPSIASTFKAFAAGVQSVNSHAMVATVKLDSDKDIAAAKQATLSALNSGCDFVIHQANAAAQGVFDACKEKNAYAFGANLNQNDNASGIIMGSAVIQAKPAFLEIAKQVKEKKYSGAVTLVGMEQKAIDFVLNPALADKIPAEVKAKIEEAKANILSGKLKVPKDDF
jgi:basic membrane lipoprotein Med (substrate-binding protein (PBP1-ABC) superfamily)